MFASESGRDKAAAQQFTHFDMKCAQSMDEDRKISNGSKNPSELNSSIINSKKNN